MKINFNGTFRETQRLVDQPLRQVEQPKGFDQLLQSISPEQPQAPGNAQQAARPEAVVESQGPVIETPRARYSFSEPQLSPPRVEPLRVASMTEEIVNVAPTSVKSPTIVSARRLTPDNPFSKLSHDEKLSTVRALVDKAALKHGVDPALSMAVVSVESGFNPVAVSSDGHNSKGLMQLLDQTGIRQLERGGEQVKYKPFDPHTNVDLGVGYLRYLHNIFSRNTELPNKSSTHAAANSSDLEKLAVAAYNAGEGRVAAAQARAQHAGKDPAKYESVEPYLPESTQQYVGKVLGSKNGFEGPSIG